MTESLVIDPCCDPDLDGVAWYRRQLAASAPFSLPDPTDEISESYVVDRVGHARKPPFAFVERATEPVRRVAYSYWLHIGSYRPFNPRFESHVQRRVDRTAGDLVEAIRFHGHTLRVATTAASLTCDTRSFRHVANESAYRAKGRLHLRWSYPDIPVWLSVQKWSHDRSVIEVSLRSRRRLRYPARYFDATHRVLAALLDELLAR